ncbi:glycosyltransferase [Falsiroseomonas sp.]|uniref:glycosyltransferase n=1 Tax=Falsiroseomonas sp. TaxID=2870721 RepID=UPI0027366E36|nr:glycosyltransferase [Falsiroseomonas sp.]MDP3415521.1 glycosyltransferase [Falsiroseomonas sp.]
MNSEVAPLALRGADIICLGPAEWGVINSVTSYTMLGMAEANRVLYVEPFGSGLTLRRAARLQRRERERKPVLEQTGDRFWIYRPPAIGLPGTSRLAAVSRINGRILAGLLRGVQRQLGFTDPILWSPLYNSGSVLRHFPARLRIFESVDFDAALARDERQRRMMLLLEAEACRAADIVFAVTDELADPLRAYNPRTYVSYCAAAPEVFGQALLAETVVPDAIARLPKPVIGYLGGVDPWKMDIGLLRHMARSHPDWSIALVGYVWFGFDASVFADCPNIHVLGPQDYTAFPNFLKGMDVCIMPFPLNDNTRRGDALKLYEYLAGGRPVVSTSVPAARRLSSVVRIADTPEHFVAAVEAALAEPPDAQAARLAAVRPHSWHARVRQKAAVIRAALDEIRPGPRP